MQATVATASSFGGVVARPPKQLGRARGALLNKPRLVLPKLRRSAAKVEARGTCWNPYSCSDGRSKYFRAGFGPSGFMFVGPRFKWEVDTNDFATNQRAAKHQKPEKFFHDETESYFRMRSSSLPVDLFEEDDCYRLFADVPGVPKSNLKIKVTPERVLVVSGERVRQQTPAGGTASEKPSNPMPARQERSYFGQFERRFQLPDNADAPGILAKVEDGVLTLTIPKSEGSEGEVQDVPVL